MGLWIQIVSSGCNCVVYFYFYNGGCLMGIIEKLGITPEPWLPAKDGSVYAELGTWIADVRGSDNLINSNLIAAAPEMLEALIECRELLSGWPAYTHICGVMRQAIEKACHPKSWEEVKKLL